MIMIRMRKVEISFLQTNCLHLHALRSLILWLITHCLYAARMSLPASIMAIVGQTEPLIVVTYGFLLNERITARMLQMLVLGYVGTFSTFHYTDSYTCPPKYLLRGLLGYAMCATTGFILRSIMQIEKDSAYRYLKSIVVSAIFMNIFSCMAHLVAAPYGVRFLPTMQDFHHSAAFLD